MIGHAPNGILLTSNGSVPIPLVDAQLEHKEYPIVYIDIHALA